MFRSFIDEPPASDPQVTQLGELSIAQMRDLLLPDALDAAAIVGRRIRFYYTSTRSANAESKSVADELKKRHLAFGAVECIVFRGRFLPEGTE